MNCDVKAYEGKDPFIFISYSHDDAHLVYPIVERLAMDGFRIWYDDGIHAGEDWTESVVARLDESSICFVMLTEKYVQSVNCRNELTYSINSGKIIVCIRLTDFDLPRHIRFQLGNAMYLERYRYGETEFFERIGISHGVSRCRADSPRLTDAQLMAWRLKWENSTPLNRQQGEPQRKTALPEKEGSVESTDAREVAGAPAATAARTKNEKKKESSEEKTAADPLSRETPAPRKGKWLFPCIVIVVLLMTAGGLFYSRRNSPSGSAEDTAASGAPAAAASVQQTAQEEPADQEENRYPVADSSAYGRVLLEGQWEEGSFSIAAVDDRTFHFQLIDNRTERIEVPELGSRWSVLLYFGPKQYSETLGDSYYMDYCAFRSDAEIYTANRYNLKDGIAEQDWSCAFYSGEFAEEGIMWSPVFRGTAENETEIPVYNYTVTIPEGSGHTTEDIALADILMTKPADYDTSSWEDEQVYYTFER